MSEYSYKPMGAAILEWYSDPTKYKIHPIYDWRDYDLYVESAYMADENTWYCGLSNGMLYTVGNDQVVEIRRHD